LNYQSEAEWRDEERKGKACMTSVSSAPQQSGKGEEEGKEGRKKGGKEGKGKKRNSTDHLGVESPRLMGKKKKKQEGRGRAPMLGNDCPNQKKGPKKKKEKKKKKKKKKRNWTELFLSLLTYHSS